METKVFIDGATQARLEIGPFHEILDDYVDELRRVGFPDSHFKKAFRVIIRFSDWVGLKQISLINLTQERIDEFWKFHSAIRDHRDYRVLGQFIQFLRERELIPPRPRIKVTCPIEKLLHIFERYMQEERGLSALYIYQQIRTARAFLTATLPGVGGKLHRLTAQMIGEYFTKLLKEQGAAEVSQSARLLSHFFKFLFIRGKIKTDLSKSMPRPANWRHTKLPVYIGPDKVQKLLDSCNRETQIGARDYAVLMVLSRLGLRACEVKNMNLEDLHWREGTMTIRGKGKESKMPLPQEVGEAVARYVKQYRPKTPSRSVFVSTFPPHHGFRLSVSISGIVKFALDRAKIETTHRGAYLLRHTVANECLKNGASLKEVAVALRHQHVGTSTYYAKVDFVRLSLATRAWIGGVQ